MSSEAKCRMMHTTTWMDAMHEVLLKLGQCHALACTWWEVTATVGLALGQIQKGPRFGPLLARAARPALSHPKPPSPFELPWRACFDCMFGVTSATREPDSGSGTVRFLAARPVRALGMCLSSALVECAAWLALTLVISCSCLAQAC